MIRVFLVEDQTIVRRGIASLLALTSDIRVSGEAADGEEALTLITAVKPDVIVMDIRLPKRSGIETMNDLHARGILTPVILLTTFDDDLLYLQGVRAGAKGFLLKDVSEDRLAEAVRIVASGGTLFQPGISERVGKTIRAELRPDFESLPEPEKLTPYERQILRLVAGGFSNREIAEQIGGAEGSVKNHVSSILTKLGVRDRTRAVLRAIELGLV